jgi:hypothetical protein
MTGMGEWDSRKITPQYSRYYKMDIDYENNEQKSSNEIQTHSKLCYPSRISFTIE